LRSTTLMTSISLLRCLTICSMIRSSPLVTIVIMDMDGSSEGATDRLSILKPRPLNRPATLDSTPNLFSTKTEMICSINTVLSTEQRVLSEEVGAPTQLSTHHSALIAGVTPLRPCLCPLQR